MAEEGEQVTLLVPGVGPVSNQDMNNSNMDSTGIVKACPNSLILIRDSSTKAGENIASLPILAWAHSARWKLSSALSKVAHLLELVAETDLFTIE